MTRELKISYPHIGDYHIPIGIMLKSILPGAEVFCAPPITKKTTELGNRYSPDFICAPFKYNLGNFIESLQAGANALFQSGLGCRYGYYGEVQEQILQDLGYPFKFVCLSRDKFGLNKAYQIFRELGSPLNLRQFVIVLLQAGQRIWIMDKLDYYLRERIGFESVSGSFARAKRQFLQEIAEAITINEQRQVQKKYTAIYRNTELNLPQDIQRVGLVGELYTLMEPYSNFYLEKRLAESGISVSRMMSASFLFFGSNDQLSLSRSGKYLRYTLGANGVDSVSQCRKYAKMGYDGIIHMKSFGCTPELSAEPVLANISRDYNLPVLHLSFDLQTSETGLETRIEAFTDMIQMKRDGHNVKNSQFGSGCGIHFN